MTASATLAALEYQRPPFQWYPVEQGRHAVDRIEPRLASSYDTTTLCGDHVVTITTSEPDLQCWPTCEACERIWRQRTNSPLRREQRR